jgi:hypothetical protein
MGVAEEKWARIHPVAALRVDGRPSSKTNAFIRAMSNYFMVQALGHDGGGDRVMGVAEEKWAFISI